MDIWSLEVLSLTSVFAYVQWKQIVINVSIILEHVLYFSKNIAPWQKAHFVNAFVPQ